ncbi:nuclear transport factor 2 family protein [Antarcticibacterium flavum]|uniref:Nuclear transport factor 2 family protein n=1 Tax=Antarcticibacterium flavum TaxID=2058175 RepID=A0A5B7WZA1_9FLAO|nr:MULTISPECIES: nuclear transport factor 2 family protein [Antarcticibacterium]MCM4161709.1 DNA-binding protein [Antarcticibacterium sp. W02-3]QCY68390.1 nuclear transport factor 2 family protein [Antarcticibacterium flavum]
MKNKEEFIRRFNEAFSNNDLDLILGHMSDDIEWVFIGEKTMKGKKAVEEFMEPMKNIETLEMELQQIIIQDGVAAANGRMKIKEPTGEIKSFGFADFYEFTGQEALKIKKMTSYVSGIKED